MAQSLGTELGKAIGTSLKESSDYKQDFFETEMLSSLLLVPIESLNLRTSLFIYKQEIGNNFVVDHPVNCYVDYNPLSMEFYSRLNGNANNETNNGVSTTVSGATVSANGVLGSSYQFDGVNDYIELTDSVGLRLTSGGTISAWIYPITFGESSSGRIVDKGTDTSSTNGYNLRIVQSDASLQFSLSGSTRITAAGVISSGVWQHVAATFDGSTMRLFVNGSTVATSSVATLGPNVSGVVRIGNRATGTDRSFEGYINNVGIYSRALAPSEISSLYTYTNTGSLGFPYYSFFGYLIDDGLGARTLSSSSEVQT